MAPSCLDKFWKWSKITYCTSKILHRSNQLKGWSQQVGYPYRQLTSSPAPGELSIFEALQILVDLGETPFQMATAVRAVRPEAPDWFHLVALIHDLGKMMALPQLAGKEWMGISDLEILCEAWCLRIQMLGRKTAHLLANTHTHTLNSSLKWDLQAVWETSELRTLWMMTMKTVPVVVEWWQQQ